MDTAVAPGTLASTTCGSLLTQGIMPGKFTTPQAVVEEIKIFVIRLTPSRLLAFRR